MNNSKGIALMMVISAIMLLSMIILEFVYGSNVNLRIAVNAKERLQAEYLAESALNLMKLELKLDQQAKSALASSPIAQYVTGNLTEPLCQQFPLSTGLLRSFFVGGQIPAEMLGAEGAEGAQEKDKSVTMFEAETATEFLDFQGDFDGSCEDEQAKMNLNVFANLDPAQEMLSGMNSYDIFKMMFVDFFKQDRFDKLFEGISPDKIAEVVRNIADWTDKNDLMNDFGNITRGSENSIYKNPDSPRPKNAKFLSLDEIHLVEGVDDFWFGPLEEMFTVYGDGKINICLAPDDLLWTLILTHAAQNQDIPVFNPNDEEKRQQLITAVRFSCGGSKPQPSKIVADLNAALGLVTVGENASNTTGWLSSMITTDSKYYTLKTSGQVGETVVNLKEVVDTSISDPKRWKVLYYKK